MARIPETMGSEDSQRHCQAHDSYPEKEPAAMRGRVIAAVLCTGPSLTQADADYLRGKCKVVVVSDAYKLAPWADAMVSHDKKWWIAHEDCDFAGPRYCGHVHDLEDRFRTERFYPAGGNSGCMGIMVADKLFKPDTILLLGADLHGTHFFGPHTRALLRNTTQPQFDRMRREFSALKRLPVVNCSPVSRLDCFPKGILREVL